MKIISLCIPLLLLLSCGHPDSDSGKSVFYYNEPSGITSLDPAFARSQANLWAVAQVFNGLLQIDERLEVQPCIAHSWELSDDGLEYVFHLRDDVFFQDDDLFPDGKGRKVVAADFAYSFGRILDPAVASPGAWIFSALRKDNPFEAPDDSTFIIHLDKPFPPFPGLLTMQYCSVVPREVVEHYGKEFRVHPVGTGPFRLSKWDESVKMILVKNSNYFERSKGEQLPYLDAVAISFIPNRESAFMEFLQGKTDFLSGIEGAYKDRILTPDGDLQEKYEKKFQLLVSPYLNTEYLGFRPDAEPGSPLSKKEIRQAISCGFSRSQMIGYLRNSIGTPANSGFVPLGLPSYDPARVKGYDYDPERCRQLLKKAGYPGGKGLPEITLNTVPSYQTYCEFIQRQLAENGIRIKLNVNADATNRELVAKGKLPFFRGSWIADYPDAENYLALFYSPNHSPKGPNTTHFSNDQYDRLYEAALNEIGTEDRYSLYQQMDSILMEEAPVVVLYYDQAVRLVQNNVSGLGVNAMNLLTLKTVKKK